ncbi:hypothetical protein PTTG_28642 [Puccinia triticina 1-1 BBBD Race 1]|uniref:Uncharacterized protein n=1 Tax=Puccinia triticina (isolate 1-1 / race 1 (BBBD)) TaxID=630390 RepID=A0A180GAU6_PUCT1|nr:hypothetical protein PTTG_28642 [Puccinia triticina 1-1 BBBD Race 1]
MRLIVSCTAFATINKVASLALELDTAMSEAETGKAPTKQKINPNTMDLLVLNGRLSDSEKAYFSNADGRDGGDGRGGPADKGGKVRAKSSKMNPTPPRRDYSTTPPPQSGPSWALMDPHPKRRMRLT